MMIVSELIQFLLKQPQDLEVVYKCHSEQCLLKKDEIIITEFCVAREDGWVQNKRPDMESIPYLSFPGN